MIRFVEFVNKCCYSHYFEIFESTLREFKHVGYIVSYSFYTFKCLENWLFFPPECRCSSYSNFLVSFVRSNWHIDNKVSVYVSDLKFEMRVHLTYKSSSSINKEHEKISRISVWSISGGWFFVEWSKKR